MEADDPFVRQRNQYVAGKLEEQLEAKIQERIRAAKTEAWNEAVEACEVWLCQIPAVRLNWLENMRKALKKDPQS